MTYTTDIKLLISGLILQHKKVDELIKASLSNKLISDELKIIVKHFLGDAQSILDYCAHAIAVHYNIVSKKIYFPIVVKQVSFDGTIGRNLPRLKLIDPKLFNYLESIQPYNGGYSWLRDLVSLSNEHKHIRLIPQYRKEIPELKMSHGGASIKLTGKCIFNLPLKGSLFLEGASIYNGQKITPDLRSDQINCDERINIKKQIWIDIKFGGTEISVLGLIKKINCNLPSIVDNIYNFLS